MSRKMLLLFSHVLSDAQREDARENWNVEQFVPLPDDLQSQWENIDPDAASLAEMLEPFMAFVSLNGHRGDLLLVQGDFGASCAMAHFGKKEGLVPVYATTKRIVEETVNSAVTVKKSIFEHRRFRRYE